MKKLFTSFMVLCATTSMSAQDPSSWKENQEVTSELSWVNTKYQGDFSGWEYVKGDENANGIGFFYDTEKCESGSIEMFNNSVGSETYQLFWLPAGYYRFTVQAFYRPGSAWNAGWDTNTDQNGIFFCDAVDLIDGEDAEGNVTTTYKVKSESSTKLMLIVEDAYQGDDKILTDDMCGDWQRDNGFTKDGLQYWVPNSMWGSSLYFDRGNYENELMVINPEDGWVKLGIRKGPETIGDDWIIFNNFRCYYVSDAGEIVQLMLAQEEVKTELEKATELHDKISENYGSLAALMDDAMIEAEYDDSSIEGCKEAIDTFKKIVSDYEAYLVNAQELTALLATCESLAATATDTKFLSAVNAARNIEQNGNGDNEMTIDSPDAYEKATIELAAARLEYIKSANSEEGIDVTSFVAYPWFCLPQYEPTWNAEENRWVPNEDALNTVASDGKLWADKDDVNGTINDLAKGVNVYGKEGTPGVWYQGGTEGGNLEVYWNDNLTCIKKWATPVNGYHDVSQLVTNVPNGYYKLKALAQTWSQDWANNCRNQIYIKSSEMESFSPYLEPGGWWGKDINQWRELETGMIQVSDGQLIISSRDNGFAAFTGFRLIYFGETPNFNSLLAATLEEAQITAESLAWQGDRIAAMEILSSIPAQITTPEEYQLAIECIAEVNEYANKANSAINNFDSNTLAGFAALTDQYTSYPEAEIAVTAQLGALEVGENPTDTYEKAEEVANDLAAYKNYLSFYQEAKKYEDNAEMVAILKSQSEDLSVNYANAEKLASYLEALATPYNKAVLAALGADKATKDNPVDVTSLIVNPNYDEDQKGWSGDNLVFNFDPSSVEKTHTAEKWNTNFDTYQTIYSLPAGNYRLQVQAIYRDHGDANGAWKNWQDAAEDMEFWDNQNAKLYANENETSIVSIASYKSETRSMTEFRDKMIEAPDADENGNIVWIEHWNYQFKNEVTDPETGVITYEDLSEENGKTDWWWDNKIFSEFDEAYYFFPASLWGISQRFAKSPEAYINTVDVYVEEGGSIKFGIRKDTLIANDWVVMDNWKLFYLGADVPEAIEGLSNSASVKNIYSVTGTRQNTMQKGINIVKTADGKVSKVLVK